MALICPGINPAISVEEILIIFSTYSNKNFSNDALAITAQILFRISSYAPIKYNYHLFMNTPQNIETSSADF